MKKKKGNRGGYRKNARRPLKYGEPTIPFYRRVPISKYNEVATKVDEILSPPKVDAEPKE